MYMIQVQIDTEPPMYVGPFATAEEVGKAAIALCGSYPRATVTFHALTDEIIAI